MGVLLVLGVVIRELKSVWETLRVQPVGAEVGTPQIGSFLAEISGHVIKAICLPAGLLLVGASVIGLLQTRFFLRSANLALRMDRLSPAQNVSLSGYLGRVLLALPRLLIVVLLGGLPGLLLARDLLSPITNRASYLALWGASLWGPLVALFCIVLSAFGIVSWIGSRFIFMQRHRVASSQAPQRE